MKTDRGEYRGIRVCLIDGKDYQALNPPSKLVLLTLKLKCGQAGICVVPALTAALVEHTGLPAGFVDDALAELQDNGWIEREHNVVWIVDALKHEPSYYAANLNHQKGILKHLNSLPRLPIVERFRKHYSYLPGFSLPDDPSSSEAGDQPASNPKESAPSVIEGAGPLAAKAPEPTWVQEGTIWWKETVGKMSFGRFGGALKEYVDKYGWEQVKIALVAYTVEMTNSGKPIRLDWFAAEAAARLNGKPIAVVRKSTMPPWKQEEHDLGIARQEYIIAELKTYKASLNGKGEEWWTRMKAQAKQANRHPIAFAHEWMARQKTT